MPSFSVAIVFPGRTDADLASTLIDEMGQAFSSGKHEAIQVGKSPFDACLHVRASMSPYPRAAVTALEKKVQKAGGRLIELWRLPKSERDDFRNGRHAESVCAE